ncbi:hypothetical protein JY97_07950 [Alkalispirochaeta odontotermitis]|nr:hypothetical protein JY97_07950 [Alkalispirochaeta odontotermitis]CAB1074939.1 hypothetical protein D1AOALGA4SA_2759 [Olavius algarvensis Delta 1 endosymbiont]
MVAPDWLKGLILNGSGLTYTNLLTKAGLVVNTNLAIGIAIAGRFGYGLSVRLRQAFLWWVSL